MRVQQWNVVIVVLAALVLVYAHERLIGDARWWNLVMAGLLLLVLARYLWLDRASRR
jgi:hypothetical protein